LAERANRALPAGGLTPKNKGFHSIPHILMAHIVETTLYCVKLSRERLQIPEIAPIWDVLVPAKPEVRG
jgi:hypothetical protein